MTVVKSLRHSNLTRMEAALLAGEVKVPSWQSPNLGIHEKVSFQDTIWGFDLAGGAFYGTPLRVTRVTWGSRAYKANIKPGDRLLRINDIDTSTLTLREAHDIIVGSGIHLKLNVTSPEDEVDAYYCYQDPITIKQKQERRLEEREEKRKAHTKGSNLNLQWPWVDRKRFMYRESNCFMVPSRYEELHKDKFPEPTQPTIRYVSDFETHQGVNGAVKAVNSIKNKKLTASIKEHELTKKINEKVSKDYLQKCENKEVKPDDSAVSKVVEAVKKSAIRGDDAIEEVLMKSGDTTPSEEKRSYSRLVSESNSETDLASNARSC